MIPVQRANILVSVPKKFVALNDAYPVVPAKTFAPLRIPIFEEYIKEVLTQGLTGGPSASENRDPIFASWGETKSVPLVAPSAELVLPSLFDEERLHLFHSDRYVFHVSFPTPNPLTYQTIFWLLPSRLDGLGRT